MKRFILFVHVCACLILIAPLALRAQVAFEAYPNYVVIGAFAVHKNAITFTGDANNHDFPARFEMNPGRNLYYVYVLATEDRARAIEEALKLRSDSKYFDTWVYSGPLGPDSVIPGAGPGVDVNPETGRAVAHADVFPASDQARSTSTGGTDKTMASLAPTANDRVEENSGTVGLSAEEKAETVESGPVRASSDPLTAEAMAGKDFYFHLFRADNRKVVEGDVDAIDFEKSRRMATYKGNSAVKVILPSGATKQMSFVCQVFGYRKQQIEFDPARPAEDFYLNDQGNLVIPFELLRLQKGDIAIMYNVFFFKDAAVMRPESRYEINNLLELLQENPTYKIRIHGHTNGSASGKIIRMNTPGNFYTLTGTKQGFGSAKELSEERATLIKDFLVYSGISADRMEVKAWGGKKPIHDKHSVRASENVRVEIEILSE